MKNIATLAFMKSQKRIQNWNWHDEIMKSCAIEKNYGLDLDQKTFDYLIKICYKNKFGMIKIDDLSKNDFNEHQMDLILKITKSKTLFNLFMLISQIINLKSDQFDNIDKCNLLILKKDEICNMHAWHDFKSKNRKTYPNFLTDNRFVNGIITCLPLVSNMYWQNVDNYDECQKMLNAPISEENTKALKDWCEMYGYDSAGH